MSDSAPRIVIGRPNGDHISITVLGRLHPNAVDFSDGNWLATPIDVCVGAFKAEIDASLRAEELRAFQDGLEHIAETLEGRALLDSMETWIKVIVSVDRLGHLDISGEATDSPGSQNRLAFRVGGLDQSDVAPMIDALRSATNAFPVIGG